MTTNATERPPLPSTDDSGSPEAPATAPTKSKRLGLGPSHVARGKLAQAALDQSAPDAGAGEAILHELIGQQTAIALAILEAQAEVAARLGYFLDDPKNLVLLTKALKELTSIGNVIGRRVEGALVTAGSLRAQRRLWQLGRS